jgi:hypothetical protein
MRFALLGLALFTFSILQVLVPLTANGQEGETSLEYQVKGAYLYNFAKFIDWPPQTFSSPTSPIILCTLGQSPFGPEFENQLREKKVRDRNLEIRRVTDAEEAGSCQILFVPSTEHAHLHDVIAELKGKSILLVGETPGFDQQGGMIQFVVEGGTVRFKINPLTAKQSGLQISSKLLQVALQVVTTGGQE